MGVFNMDQLPDATRIWIYAVNRPLNNEEVQRLTKRIGNFMTEWTAHKRELQTAWQLKYDQFLIVAVDESQMAASGCSIDSLVHFMKQFEEEIDCQIVGTSIYVFYRDNEGRINALSRPAFKSLVLSGDVNGDTIVFNNVLQTLGELRAGKWEVPMQASWHKEAFAVAG